MGVLREPLRRGEARSMSVATGAKPAWERFVRKWVGLPRHCTANDEAAVLLRLTVLSACAAALVCVCMGGVLGRLALYSWLSFAGVSLQQYVWYTGRVFVECWSDEGVPVVAVAAITAMVFGAFSLLCSVLLTGVAWVVVLGTLQGSILSSYKWAFYGSLFDGTEKSRSDFRSR